jgi:hypothetical protein
MARTAVQQARSAGAERIEAVCQPTTRNTPCVESWRNFRFDLEADGRTFVWDSGGIVRCLI